MSHVLLVIINVEAIILLITVSTQFLHYISQIISRPSSENYRPVKVILDIMACIVQLSAILFWPLLIVLRDNYGDHEVRTFIV